ncbi:MAG: hypothetical protein WCG75_05765 [Armatimonadota bacterium]
MDQLIADADTKFEAVAIFGGMLRELALNPPKKFSSDIDLVVRASSAELSTFAASYDARPNKFGGFRFVYNGWYIDLWTLDSTWANRQGYFHLSKLEDLVQTTFFNIDAIVYLTKEKSVFASEEFFQGLEDHVLDINFQPNPFPSRCARRAIKMFLNYEFDMSTALARFVVGEFRNIESPSELEVRAYKYLNSELISSDDAGVISWVGTPDLFD